VERGAGPDLAGDRRGQRLEQERRLADPIRQRRALEFDAVPAIDDALAMERNMVAILGDQDMGQQSGTRPAALDRQ
jgi:hypothetical protein